MRDRRAEAGEHGIARMIDDRPAVVDDDAVYQLVKAPEKILDVLRVEACAKCGIAGDVGEQHGGLAAFAMG